MGKQVAAAAKWNGFSGQPGAAKAVILAVAACDVHGQARHQLKFRRSPSRHLGTVAGHGLNAAACVELNSPG
jgi:hypothetical protein